MKIYATSVSKFPKSQKHYFDKLKFIINLQNVSLCIPKIADETGVISAELERESPGFSPEGSTKFVPWFVGLSSEDFTSGFYFRSKRRGFHFYVQGQVKEISKKVFNLKVMHNSYC